MQNVSFEGGCERPEARVSLRRKYTGIQSSDIAISAMLLFCIVVLYARVAGFDFINFDDSDQVYNNFYVRGGLSLTSIRGAFTSTVVGNWIPVTMLSHMLDVQLFGMHSGWHHLANVCYHAATAVLLFLFLQRATGARAASAFVAFMFGVHPLHVESVAWVSERKDVLSGLLFVLTLYAYLSYVERPGRLRYVIALATYALGLMAKPMLLTVPFILLLIDLWPLERARTPKLLWEKVPFLLLALADTFVTIFAQNSAGTIKIEPVDSRLANAMISYVTYIRQMFWPVHLALIYPYPRFILAWQALVALVMLLAATVIIVGQWRKHPYLATGWFWYLGMLIPVIGFIRFGSQFHADRYTYLPMIGLSIMLAWGASEILGQRPFAARAVGLGAAILSCVWAISSWVQLGFWSNTETVFTHTIQVTQDNYVAQTALAEYLMHHPERNAEAVEHLELALQINPRYAEAQCNYGICLARQNLCDAAVPHFQAALQFQPRNQLASKDLGLCLAQLGRFAAAIEQLENRIRTGPDDAEVRFLLADLLSNYAGRDSDAIANYEAGLRLDRLNAGAHRKLATLLARTGHPEEAASHLRAAHEIQ